MFSRISTKRSTSGFSAQIARLRRALDEADAVVIGAGAGLSTAAGFTYNGERFERYFSDFAEKYADQLRIYKEALRQYFELPVKECLIYSLHLATEIKVW